MFCIFPFLLSCLSPPVCQYRVLHAFSCVIPSSSHPSSSLLSPHLFLISSLVSVYLVSACPRLFVLSLLLLLFGLSVVFNVSCEFLPPSSLFFLFLSGMWLFFILNCCPWVLICTLPLLLALCFLCFCHFVSFSAWTQFLLCSWFLWVSAFV